MSQPEHSPPLPHLAPTPPSLMPPSLTPPHPPTTVPLSVTISTHHPPLLFIPFHARTVLQDVIIYCDTVLVAKEPPLPPSLTL